MNSDTSRGTFEEVISNCTPLVASIAQQLRVLMGEVDSNIVEQPRPAEEHARYAVGTDKNTEVFGYISPLKNYVRLGFYYGAALPDPAGLLVGTGKRLRHIKIYSQAEAGRAEIRQLLEAAVQERRKANRST